MMVPAKFTDIEGADWMPWPFPEWGPPVDFYSRRVGTSPVAAIRICFLDGDVRVHSLVTPQGYRWDCINGWTGKVTE